MDLVRLLPNLTTDGVQQLTKKTAASTDSPSPHPIRARNQVVENIGYGRQVVMGWDLTSWSYLAAWKMLIGQFRALISEMYAISSRTPTRQFQTFQSSTYPPCDHNRNWIRIYPICDHRAYPIVWTGDNQMFMFTKQEHKSTIKCQYAMLHGP